MLTRTYQVPPASDIMATTSTFPALSTLEPLAPMWTLHVRSVVPDSPSSSLDRMQQGVAQLMDVSQKLLGVFDFMVFDRRVYDTRILGNRA